MSQPVRCRQFGGRLTGLRRSFAGAFAALGARLAFAER
jgi:hypothetical protein